MIKPIYCKFNMDNTCVEAIYLDGTMISIYTPRVSDEIADSIQQKAELEWLVWNVPEEYLELVLRGQMQEYLKMA